MPYAGKIAGGFAPLHLAVVTGNEAIARKILARGVDATLPLPRDARHGELKFPEGSTPLKIAELTRKQFAKEYRDVKGVVAIAALLKESAKKAPPKKSAAKSKSAARKTPPWQAAIDAELVALAKFGKHDVEALRETLEGIDTRGMGPWNYLTAALEQGSSELFSDKAAKKLKGSLLLRLLEGRDVEGETDPDPRHYPRAARKGLEAGMIVASSDADVFFLWPQKDKTAKVCHAHPESFSVLGETVVDFVQKQVKLLVG